jgi:biotin-(acetyl-CoA carboxylase) ligase
VGTVLEHVSAWLEAEPARIREQWLALGTLRDRRCALRVEGNPIVGVVRDLDAQWRLVLEVRDGSRVRIDAAHAHFEEIDQVRS